MIPIRKTCSDAARRVSRDRKSRLSTPVLPARSMRPSRHLRVGGQFAPMSAYDPKRTFVKIELRLGYPKSFFEGALEWMFMPTSERDDVGSLFFASS